MEELFEEHANLFNAFHEKVTRPKGAKFHLDRLGMILEKMREFNDKNKQVNSTENQERNWKLLERNVFYFKELGNWLREIGNLGSSEENLEKSLSYINDSFRIE